MIRTLASILDIDESAVADVVTSGFGVHKAGFSERHAWPNMHRPRTAWRRLDVMPYLTPALRARFRGPWVATDFTRERKNRYTLFVSECRDAPLLVMYTGLPPGERLQNSSRTRPYDNACKRQLSCGWCAKHLGGAISEYAPQLGLNKLVRHGGCTR